MRVWFLDPRYLDGKRLGAAHFESHCLRTCLVEGRRWGVSGLYERGAMGLKRAHDAAAVELVRRKHPHLVEGLTGSVDWALAYHETPWELAGLPEEMRGDLGPGSVEDYRQDVIDLRAKWEAEGYYYGTGRFDLRVEERAFGLVEGPDPVLAQVRREETREFLKRERGWFESYRKRKPGSRLQDRLAAWYSLEGGR